MLFVFFFNDTATTEIYTLSLHDALPIYPLGRAQVSGSDGAARARKVGARACDRADARDPLRGRAPVLDREDRKSTRLNSSHANISYAVFCLKKKKTTNII